MESLNSSQRIQNEINRLELKSYRVSTVFGTGILALYGVLISLVLIFAGIGLLESLIYLLLFLVFSGWSAYVWQQKKDLKTLKAVSYSLIIFTYLFITYLLINTSLPGIFANIFLAFTVGYLYLDERATWINHILMALSSSLLIWIFPNIFGLEDASLLNLVIANLIILMVLLFLFISSLFNLRKKRHDYIRLARHKENEFKIIEILMDLENEYFSQKSDFDQPYSDLKLFFEQFSQKVGIENIFEERINLIKEAQDLSQVEFFKKHPELTEEARNYLVTIGIHEKGKLRYLAFKLAQSHKVDFDYSMNQDVFNSLRHFEDSQLVKLVIFSALLIFFRLDKRELQAISNAEFIDLLEKSDLVNKIEPKILKVFRQYEDVIEDILTDAIEGGKN
jgi:hypothetical protein